jgi:hypothetical protein
MFGFENLWLNLVDIPARLGWADISSRIALRKWALATQIVLPILGLVVVWRMHHWPSAQSASGRFFTLGALAYGAMLPIGLFAFFKIGGDTNLLHSWNYVMPAALLVWLTVQNGWGHLVQVASVLTISLCVHGSDFLNLPSRPYTQQLISAAELTDRFPRTIWFPQNPLITYFAHGKLWHSEDGA